MMNPTSTSWPAQRKLALVHALTIGFLGIIVLATASNLFAITRASKRVTRTYEIDAGLAELRIKLDKADLGLNTFLFTGDESDLGQYRRAVVELDDSIARLKYLVGGDPNRWELMNGIERSIVGKLSAMAEATRSPTRKGAVPDPTIDKRRLIRQLSEAVERQIKSMAEYVGKSRTELKATRNEFYFWSVCAFVIASVLDLILLLALQYLNNRSRKKLILNAEWLGTTLRSIGDAVIATDPEGRISFMNGIAEELTGWTEAQSTGRPLGHVFNIINETTREPARNPVSRVLATGAIQGLANHTILISKGGSERPIDDSAAPIRDPQGKIHGAVMVFRDITREKADQSERDRLYRELSERDKRKDEFLAMLAHELRNPLAAIGNALMLSSSEQMWEHRDWAQDVIRRQMRHLSRLIDDLLDVSRISRGKIELRCDRVNAAVILANAIETVRPLIEDRQHSLTTSVDPADLWTEADPTRLEQVLVNILSNAAKYTDRGGRIGVSGRLEGDFVAITVKDTGVGIPPDKLPEMFELFAQGDRSLARSEGGLGIGLTLVKRLVEMHGGTITARSEGIGKGSEFTIKLPSAPAPDEPLPVPVQPGRERGMSRILVVDDNVDTVLGLSRILTLLGHHVSTALTGPEAIETARTTRPDFILLDIGLPGMDGFEVARQLRAEECAHDAVIIAITGYGQEEDRHRTQASGFDHHLVKPLDHGTLISLLARQPSISGPNLLNRSVSHRPPPDHATGT